MTCPVRRMVFTGTIVTAAFLLCGAKSASDPLGWNAPSVAALRAEVEGSVAEALSPIDPRPLETALTAGNGDEVNRIATDIALKLAANLLLGQTAPAKRTGWGIPDTDRGRDLRKELSQALEQDRVAAFFRGLRPAHPDYAALGKAYQAETDPARRAQLAFNLERWRWMPSDPGQDYLIVNTASFQASLWRGGALAGNWPVVVGKRKTPTPVFAATVSGVTLNPWWDIPPTIVRESIGALVRKNPALARQRGYVWGGGRYRQRPGPNNALGQMKLVMPNAYNVYLHDTPSKDLFSREVRAFSHGCIRVGSALDFARSVLAGAETVERFDALLASGKTATIPLGRTIPVYITYFTAVVGPDGATALLPDIYGRDRGAITSRESSGRCAA